MSNLSVKNSLAKKLNPAVRKGWLYLIAGIIWSGVGIWLSYLAYGWLKSTDWITGLGMATIGVLLAIAINAFGFSRFANRNIQRINQYANDRVCMFAFQSWTSYPLVVFMISLGIFLRKYSPIPKPYLAAMYLGIGGSLFLASFLYYRTLLERSNKSK
ncbi:MAG: hypothetical protein ISR58_00190 [Anaerolineales bacterium]|nr:hypothetical protein [Chloroflexota bacterium]MBL6979581.1 hypothetical protein [Anaerolineales bacterium]